MGVNSKIEWTHHTFNPWGGCTKVSPACDHCYAESDTKAYGFVQWGKDADRRVTSSNYWKHPLKWNREALEAGKRRRVFCGSWCDVMEDRHELDPIRTRLYALIKETPWLDWLLLTKRPQNFRRFLPAAWLAIPRPNVWLMTTVETPEYFWRITALKQVPAVVRGLSIEPMLTPMPTLSERLAGIDWVICGGESGPKARPMQVDWARSIRDQCVERGVAFFFKQWGEWSEQSVRVGKKAAGRVLDGRTWDEMPGWASDACSQLYVLFGTGTDTVTMGR